MFPTATTPFPDCVGFVIKLVGKGPSYGMSVPAWQWQNYAGPEYVQLPPCSVRVYTKLTTEIEWVSQGQFNFEKKGELFLHNDHEQVLLYLKYLFLNFC